MSDDRFRAAQRAEASGDPLAAARVLVERVRRGDLPAEWVALAALLGREDARACGYPVPDLGEHAPKCKRPIWCAVAKSGRVLATICVAWAVDCAETLPDQTSTSLEAIQAARAWVKCPCKEHAAEAQRAWDSADSFYADTSSVANYAAAAAAYAASAASSQAGAAAVHLASPSFGLLAADAAEASTPPHTNLDIWRSLRLAAYLLKEITP